MFLINMVLFINCCSLTFTSGSGRDENILIKEWECASPECTVPISEGEMATSYFTPDHNLKLTFKAKEPVTVLRKPAKSEKVQDLWWIRVKGKEGYANSQFVKEKTILSKKLMNVNESELERKLSISPSTPYEVAEGTTIYHGLPSESPKPNDTPNSNSLGASYDRRTEYELESEDAEKKEMPLSFGLMNDSAPTDISTVAPNLALSVTEQSILEKENSSVHAVDSQISKNQPEEINKVKTSSFEDPSLPLQTRDNVADGGTNIQFPLKNVTNESFNEESLSAEDNSKINLNINSTTDESSDGLASMTIEEVSSDNISEQIKDNNVENTVNIDNKLPEKVTRSTNGIINEVGTTLLNHNGHVNNVETVSIESEKLGNSSDLNSNSSSQQILPLNLSSEMKNEIEAAAVGQSGSREAVASVEVDSDHENESDGDDEINKTSSNGSISLLHNGKEAEEKTTIENNVYKVETAVTSTAHSPNLSIISSDVDSLNTSPKFPGDVSTAAFEGSNSDEPPEVPTVNTFSDDPTHSPITNFEESKKLGRNEIYIGEPTETTQKVETIFSEQDYSQRQNSDSESREDPPKKWYSSVHSFMDSLNELYISALSKPANSESGFLSSKIEEPDENVPRNQYDQEERGKLSDEYFEEKSHEESLFLPKDNFGQIINSEPDIIFKEANEDWSSFKSVIWLVGSSLVILCFSLGYYYLENVKRDGELVQKNNVLASQLFILEREKAVLEDEFITIKENINKLVEEKKKIDEELLVIKGDLRKSKEEKMNVEERETKLIKKLVMVEQNYNELRRIFSESKQKGERATLISDIKKLKESIAADNLEISSLKEELQEKKNEVKSLSANVEKYKEAKLDLQERIDKMVIEGQEIVKGYQETLAKMEQTIEENKVMQSKLEEDLRNEKKECESLFIEKELAESALQKAHGLTSTESLAEWLDVKVIRSSLIDKEKTVCSLTQERDQLLLNLKSAEDKGRSLTSDVLQLNEKYENAEKEKIEALTKLQVLSNYFKEKETQLQEELGMKEAQWLQKQSDDSTIYQQMRDLREENVNLKSLIETLKKEILDQETTYKKIINTTEQKAHENWVSFHRAEIRLKEVQAEAAQLRNRLTTLETCDNGPEEKLNKRGIEVNGDLPPLGSAMSPPFMLYPNEFIPPPPILPPPAGGTPSSRPPPLGRISSPPLVSGEFIPPPPLLPPYEVYSSVNPTPPSPSHAPPMLHKPQPRDHHAGQAPLVQAPPVRKQKDSQSSTHSSESPLEKTPARRSKR